MGARRCCVSFSLGSQFLAQYLVTAETPEGRVQELQRRFTVPAMEVFTEGLYAAPDIADRYRHQVQRGDVDARGGSSPWRPRRTEPNAPAGDPPSRENIEQGPPSQPAA